MDIIVRIETPNDHKVVFELISKSFKNDINSDHKEQILVEKLRKSNSFIPELSLVAELNNQVIGYILLTKIKIIGHYKSFESLALAPICVLPKYQNHGIGSNLILFAHEEASKLGYKSIILLGHENYYPRFGYKQAHLFNINLPFDVPKKNCMVKELVKNSLRQVKGMVEYPKEFY